MKSCGAEEKKQGHPPPAAEGQEVLALPSGERQLGLRRGRGDPPAGRGGAPAACTCPRAVPSSALSPGLLRNALEGRKEGVSALRQAKPSQARSAPLSPSAPPRPSGMMGSLHSSLMDSELVARFQHRCGLFLTAAEEGGDGERRPKAALAAAANGGHLPSQPQDARNGLSPAEQRRARKGWRQDSLQEYVIKNYFYYYLFRISAAMGQEVFYITFLPFCYWSINPYIARRLIIIWPVVMYIGQVSKDLLKWPRPYSPPVVRLEKRTTAEYGMPSTHAMAATAISFTFVIASASQYKFPLILGLMGALFFSTLVCLSRIYTGMHTVLDVIIGSLISALLTALVYPVWDIIDHLMVTSPLCPAFIVLVPLFLCYHYPKLDYYSPTRADTTTVLGAGAGSVIGFWINHQYISNALPEAISRSVSSLTSEMLLMALARFLVGIGVLLVTRQIIKNVALKLLYFWYEVSTDDCGAKQQINIEVPYKFITYSSIGLSATVLVPLLHRFLGLN